jgi:hypothetical protein
LQFLLRGFGCSPFALALRRLKALAENIRGYSGRFVFSAFWPVPPNPQLARGRPAIETHGNAFLGRVTVFAAATTLDRL